MDSWSELAGSEIAEDELIQPSAPSVSVLVLGDDAHPLLKDALAQGGFDRISVDAVSATRNGAASPDVTVINVTGCSDDVLPRFCAIAEQFKSTAADRVPLLAFGPRGDIERLKQRGSEKLFDEILSDPVSAIQICRRISTLARLNTMHGELTRRMKTWSRFGVDAPFDLHEPGVIEDANILVLGATSEFPVIENTLAPQATLVGALTRATALDYLSRRTFDLVLVDLPDALDEVEEFCRHARRNPRLFNLPILVVTDDDATEQNMRAVAAGATDHLPRPLDEAELGARAMALVREVRHRENLREIYARARHLATSDGLTGLYSRGFLIDHLDTMIADAERTRQVFSMAFFEIENINAINQTHGFIAGDRIIRQVGEMMGLLVRGEDLMARFSGARFACVLPSTRPRAAQVALDRITGVVNFTEFAARAERDHPRPSDVIRVHLSSGVSGYRGGDTPEELVGRARFICAGAG